MIKNFNIATTATLSYFPFLSSFIGSYFYHHRAGLSNKLFVGTDDFPASIQRKLQQYEGIEIFPLLKESPPFDGVHGEAWTNAVSNKLEMAKEILERTNEPLLLIDNDILFVDSITGLFHVDHDIVVTHIQSERERHVRRDGLPINFIASVVLFNNVEKSKEFIKAWQSLMRLLMEKTVPPFETPALNVLLNQIASGQRKDLKLNIGVIQDTVIASDQSKKVGTRAVHLKSWGPSTVSAIENYWRRSSRRSFDGEDFAPAHLDTLAMEDWFCNILYSQDGVQKKYQSVYEHAIKKTPPGAPASKQQATRMKRYIFADGGLANRLLCILYPLSRGVDLESNVEILWPRTNWCDCDFFTLFQSELTVKPLHLDSLAAEEMLPKETLVLTHLRTPLASHYEEIDQKNIRDQDYFSEIWSSLHRPILYNHHSLPHYWVNSPSNISNLAKSLRLFKPRDEILVKVRAFIEQHNINRKSTIGLHIRGTDFFPSTEHISRAEQFIKENKAKKIFLCTDDSNIISRLAVSSNVITIQNDFFVDFDPQEKKIHRTQGSVVNALIDLMILSNTNAIKNSHSSYLALSVLLGEFSSTDSQFRWL
jgi:hypothetical protein